MMKNIFSYIIGVVSLCSIPLWILTTYAAAPQTSLFSPEDDASQVLVDTNLSITFDQNVSVGTGNIIIKKIIDDSIFETIDITSGQITGWGTDTLTIDPINDLDFETEYYINIDATAIENDSAEAYSGINDTTTWNFTTTAENTTQGITTTTLSPLNGDPEDTSTPIEFTANVSSTALVEGDKIKIYIPNDFRNLENITPGDLSFTTADLGINNGSTPTIDTTTRTITYTLGTGESLSLAEDVIISIGTTNFLTLPDTEGQYVLNIFTTNATDAIQERGVVTINISNTASITILVEEKLILSIDNPLITINVNPSVNNGIDQTKSTTITVKTNALSYSIHGSLENAKGNNKGVHLFDNGTDYYIGNGWDVADGPFNDGENIFGYNTTAAGEATASFSQSNSVIFGDVAGLTSDSGNQHTVYYDVDVDYRIKSGIYKGAITYTAVPTF